MTLDEIADEISEGLERWQRDANLSWLLRVWESLKLGGVWYYPLDTSMWVKTTEGFDKAGNTYIADAIQKEPVHKPLTVQEKLDI